MMDITELAPGVIVTKGPWTSRVESLDLMAGTADIFVMESEDETVNTTWTATMEDLDGYWCCFDKEMALMSPSEALTWAHRYCDPPTEEHPFYVCGINGGLPCPPVVALEEIVVRDFDYYYVFRFGRDENNLRVQAYMWPPDCRTRPFP